MFGLIMLGSATAPMAQEKFGNAYYFLWRQVVYGLLPGALLFYVLRRVPLTFWERAWKIMLPVSVILLLLVFVPGLGKAINGSRSWLQFGGHTMQPAEIVKFTFLVFIAGWLANHALSLAEEFTAGFLPYLFYVGLIVGLLVLQPDVGTMLVFFSVALILAIAAGAAWRHVGVVILLGLVGVGLLVAAAPYRLQRITSFLHPENDLLASGYHVRQSLVAIGGGGILGAGFGNSRQKYLYLPEVSADSVFPVIAEEFGIFSGLLIAAYVVLVLKGFQLANAQTSDWARFYIIGVVSWIGVQTFLNIGAMLGVLPLTGLPLPLISHGGTALMMLLAALGVVAGITWPPVKKNKHAV